MNVRKTDSSGQLDRLERHIAATVQQTPPAAWPRFMWGGFDALGDAAQRRVLSAMVRRCVVLAVPPTPQITARLDRLLLPPAGRGPRNAVRDKDAVRKAAQYKAAHPDAPTEQIARHAGVAKNTVALWLHGTSSEFSRFLADEQFLLANDAERQSAIDACRPIKKGMQDGN